MGGQSRAGRQVDVCPVCLSASEPRAGLRAPQVPAVCPQGSAPRMAGPRSGLGLAASFSGRERGLGRDRRPRTHLGVFSVLEPKGQKDGHKATEGWEAAGH